MNVLDERTIARCLRTSSPQARWRYEHDTRAYDPPLSPRDYATRCACCGDLIVVTPLGHRRAGCDACRERASSRAYYRRHRERVIARVRAYQARKAA